MTRTEPRKPWPGWAKALRNFGILVGAICGFALLLIWGLGVLGPVRLIDVTEAQAQARCEQEILSQLGEVRGAEFQEIRSTQRQSRWSISGEVITEGQAGGFWSHLFSCQVEVFEGTWGMTAGFRGNATRLSAGS